MLELKAFRVEREGEASLALVEGGTPLPPITEFGVNTYAPEQELQLSIIVREFNDRFGGHMTDDDMVQLARLAESVCDASMAEMIRQNPVDVVRPIFLGDFEDKPSVMGWSGARRCRAPGTGFCSRCTRGCSHDAVGHVAEGRRP